MPDCESKTPHLGPHKPVARFALGLRTLYLVDILRRSCDARMTSAKSGAVNIPRSHFDKNPFIQKSLLRALRELATASASAGFSD
jgi:hypothetical protein